VTQTATDHPKKKKRKLNSTAAIADNSTADSQRGEGGGGAAGGQGTSGGRVSGEAFRRVDVEEWSKQIIEGLEDNSCKEQTGRLLTVHSSSIFLYHYS